MFATMNLSVHRRGRYKARAPVIRPGVTSTSVLECVVNLSEGRDPALIDRLRAAAGPCLLDVHCDGDHHRSVFSLAGPADMVQEGARSLAREAVASIDVRFHHGVHPRIGALDVVPFIALDLPPGASLVSEGDVARAVDARDRFARWAGQALRLPCFLYGPETPGVPARTLPQLRRGAWHELAPDTGPSLPHRSAGACAVGARGLLVAYNLWLSSGDMAEGVSAVDVARRIAAQLRGPLLRTLGLALPGGAQVSCNLIAPRRLGPAAVFDAVARHTPIARAELVGLIPRSVLDATDPGRWAELGIGPEATIEARLEQAGLDGGRFLRDR
jgi:glutamate formiminotransferase